MKTIIFAALICGIVLIVACTAEYQAIDTSKVEIRGDGLVYQINKEKPYTGKTFGRYENGQKKYESNWKNGKREGLVIEWYENGQKAAEINWKDGKQDGLVTQWHKNGQKKAEANDKNGKREGLATFWYDNGQKEAEENWKDDKRVGKWTEWDEKGNITSTKTY